MNPRVEFNTAPLCALLPDADLSNHPQRLADLADLLERARFPRRGIPSEDVLDLEGHVRIHEKRYGKRDSNGELLYGERKTSVNRICEHISKWVSCRWRTKTPSRLGTKPKNCASGWNARPKLMKKPPEDSTRHYSAARSNVRRP
jgi:hypothetical protein